MDKTVTKRVQEPNDDIDAIWKPAAAADFLGVSIHTLATWRRTGEGPRYVPLSRTRVGYTKRDMVAWVDKKRRQSTSEAATSSGGAS